MIKRVLRDASKSVILDNEFAASQLVTITFSENSVDNNFLPWAQITFYFQKDLAKVGVSFCKLGASFPKSEEMSVIWANWTERFELQNQTFHFFQQSMLAFESGWKLEDNWI